MQTESPTVVGESTDMPIKEGSSRLGHNQSSNVALEALPEKGLPIRTQL